MDYFSSLPDEMIEGICEQMDVPSLVNVSISSSRIERICRNGIARRKAGYLVEIKNQKKAAAFEDFLSELSRIENFNTECTFVEVNETGPDEDSTGIQIHKISYINDNGSTCYRYRIDIVVNGDVLINQFYDSSSKPILDFNPIKHIAIIHEGNILREINY